MLKTKIVNKKGFMLVETLIVSVFILAVFSLLYTNTERDAIYECSAYEAVNSIDKIYLTTYNLTDIKNAVDNDPTNTYKRDFTEYINYLPTYSKNSFRTPEYGYYRVIVEYVSNDVHKYGNMEARKGAVTNEEP